MIRGKVWRVKSGKVEQVHVWRPRRSRYGELVQWDTSEHDWLEGRGEKLYLIVMIDDATSRLFARFVRHDTTEENMKLLWRYLEKFGRPVAFYTDKASIFRTAEKRKRDEPGVDKDPVEMPPTQIGRGLREVGIAWIAAHSPQEKGRVERNFQTAQERLVEKRLDGSLAVRYGERYLPVTVCDVAERPKASPTMKAAKPRRTGQRGSNWGKDFDLKKGPKVWQVAAGSGHRKGTAE